MSVLFCSVENDIRRRPRRKVGRDAIALVAIATATLGLVCASAMPASAAVFGSDDREPLPAVLKPLEGRIGYLFNTPARTVCTAFCVADDAIATAAHCLYRTRGEPLPRTSDFRFARGNDGPGQVTAVAGYTTGSAAQNVLTGSMRLNVRPPIEATRDWAIVRLAAPVCRGRTLKLREAPAEELAALSRARKLFQVAYHRDLATWSLAYSRPCRVKRDTERASWESISRDFVAPHDLILHDCDTGAASSGSPILIETSQGPEVVGINVGTYVQSRVIMQGDDVVHRFKSETVANTGVAVSAFARRMVEFLDQRPLSGPAEVRTLQVALKARGDYAGALDGAYGPELHAAIERFEARTARPVTGAATQALLAAVAGPTLATAQNLPTRAVSQVPPILRTGTPRGKLVRTALRRR